MRMFPFFSRSQRSAPAPRRGLRLISLLVLLGLLSGCMVRLAYPQVDTWLRWQIDDAVDLDSDQSRWIKPRLAALLKWHRYQELPRYVVALEDLKTAIRAGTADVVFMKGLRERMAGFMADVGHRAAPDLAGLLGQLSEAQFAAFLADQEKNDAELQASLTEMSEAERQEAITEAWEERLEDWLGRLQPEQKARIRDYVAILPDLRSERIDSRQRWREGLKSVWAARAGVDPATDPGFHAQVQSLFESHRWRSERYQALDAQQRRDQDQFMADIAASLSDQQKKRLIGEIDGWLGDFRALAKP